MSETQELDSKIIKGLTDLNEKDKIKLIKLMGGFNHGVSTDENRILNSFSALVDGKKVKNKSGGGTDEENSSKRTGLQNLLGGFFNYLLPPFLQKNKKSKVGGSGGSIDKDKNEDKNKEENNNNNNAEINKLNQKITSLESSIQELNNHIKNSETNSETNSEQNNEQNNNQQQSMNGGGKPTKPKKKTSTKPKKKPSKSKKKPSKSKKKPSKSKKKPSKSKNKTKKSKLNL